jgi:hypothetical protein
MKIFKLTKMSWVLLASGIFVVIIISLGLTRSQQIKAYGQLDEELSLAETRLSKLQVSQLKQQQQELQGQLDEAKVQLAAAKDKMRQTVESADVTDTFYDIARACSVTVEGMGSSAVKSEELEGVDCLVIALSAVVTGETPNLVDFIIRLNRDYATGVVKSAQISIPVDSTANEPSASIQMVVYAYGGY